MSAQAAGGVLQGHRPNLLELNRLAAAGLPQMIDPKTGLFCHRIAKGAGGFVREGVSPRYTTMSALGLNRWNLAGGTSPISIQGLVDALLADRAWLDNIGDLGLMLWVSAEVAPGRLQDIYNSLRVASAWDRLGVGEVRTMEMAWFLTGLSCAVPCLPADLAESARTLAGQTYRQLIKNQGESGLCGHQAIGTGWLGKIRGRIGSFADQVYPILGLTQYGKTFGDHGALERARQCADAICDHQGPLGQWWWHYNAGSGKTFQRYPVYSVHQDGMAPMALWAVGEATGRDYRGAIYKGLSWIYGNNELGCDMRDESSLMIWRSIYGQGVGRRTREVSDLLGMSRQSTGDLRVLYECRPYHLGWLLYAFAGWE